MAPYFQIFGRHEFGRIGGVAKGSGDVEGGGDIGGAIEVVVAMNSEGRLVLGFKSCSRLNIVAHRSYAIVGRHGRVFAECLKRDPSSESI